MPRAICVHFHSTCRPSCATHRKLIENYEIVKYNIEFFFIENSCFITYKCFYIDFKCPTTRHFMGSKHKEKNVQHYTHVP